MALGAGAGGGEIVAELPRNKAVALDSTGLELGKPGLDAKIFA